MLEKEMRKDVILVLKYHLSQLQWLFLPQSISEK